MPYWVSIKRSAEKELDATRSDVRERIIKRLLVLESEPRPKGVKKLQGEDAYRLRVGDYRILYTINDIDKTIMIYAVGHRRDVYR